MQNKASGFHQIFFLMPTLAGQVAPRPPLKQLADTLPWAEFVSAFGQYYSPEGRPAKPVRLMVGLLLLKQMFNQGDENRGGGLGAKSVLAILLREERVSMAVAL
jgi:transposase, IS5 family